MYLNKTLNVRMAITHLKQAQSINGVMDIPAQQPQCQGHNVLL